MSAIEIIEYVAADAPLAAAVITGKFLQIRWRGREYLLFAPFELDRYHNQILARFAQQQRIPHAWLDEQTLELGSAELIVIGGGRFRADHARKRLALWDDSQIYGRFDERGLAHKIAAAHHPWRHHQIEIT